MVCIAPVLVGGLRVIDAVAGFRPPHFPRLININLSRWETTWCFGPIPGGLKSEEAEPFFWRSWPGGLREEPIPEPSEAEVLVRMIVSAITAGTNSWFIATRPHPIWP